MRLVLMQGPAMCLLPHSSHTEDVQGSRFGSTYQYIQSMGNVSTQCSLLKTEQLIINRPNPQEPPLEALLNSTIIYGSILCQI